MGARMTFDIWITYVAAYAAICLIPGPSVAMVVAQTLSHGRRGAVLCITGDLLGGVVVMAAAQMGVGAILATSSVGFMAIKWTGVAYMAYLGVTQIRGARNTAHASPTRPNSLRAGFWTGILNPKAIMFYVAFFAQFINPGAPIAPQATILMISSTLVVALVLGGYALCAVRVARHLATPRRRAQMQRTSGALMLGGSATLALR